MADRIITALLKKGRLKDTDLIRARRLQEETGGSLLALLARLGLVSEGASPWLRMFRNARVWVN